MTPPTPIKRGAPPRRKGKSRFPKRRDDAYREWIRAQPCVLWEKHECWWPVACCHLKTKNSSGYDRENCFPGCVYAHNEQEGRTKQFQQRWGIDLKAICIELDAQYEQE